MDHLNLNNIDKNFSSELLALMGEWITFHMFKREVGLQEEEHTIRQFFETGVINAYGGLIDNRVEYGPPSKKVSVFYDGFLKAYCIVKEFYEGEGIVSFRHIAPIVVYDDVKRTFRENLSDDKTPIFPIFAFLSRGCLPTSENISFSFDVGCYPLIRALCNEGHMA